MFERRFLTHSVALSLLTLAATSLGCNDGRAQLPTGPSPQANQPSPPAQPPTSAVSIVTDISPNTGGTVGATLVRIIGRGLQGSGRVTFGGVAASRVGWSPDGTSVFATTPPGGAGAVDVVVTSRAGQAITLSQGFIYGLATPLLVTAISPNMGAAAGGTYLAIAGSGFQFGATVTLDGVETGVRYQSLGTELGLTTRPHQAGSVDVVVTNPDGQVVRLNGGYTYASPQFKDFNGEWEGWLGDEGETPLRFTVQNDVLVSLSCASAVPLTTLPGTKGGEFSMPGNGRPAMTGALVRADYAEGTLNLNLAACTGYDTIWSATRH